MAGRPTTNTPPERGDVTVAVVIPCYNEAQTVARVVRDFRLALPAAVIHVIDNASSDDTADRARAAGASVFLVPKRGKGHVVRAALQRIDADVYLMVDGDDTYDAGRAADLVAPVLAERADMVVGRRVAADPAAYRRFHAAGNRLVGGLIRMLFDTGLTDIMSGYRAFSREVARCTPLVSRGFEIETELTVQALGQDFVIDEIETPYRARPGGSDSKLRTFRDGAIVLWTILRLFMAYKPLTFFGSLGALLAVPAIALGVRPFLQVSEPSAPGPADVAQGLAAVFLGVCSLGSILLGVVLTNVNNRFMALASLMTRGRLAERHSRAEKPDRSNR